MNAFKDKMGRDWIFEINVDARKKVLKDTQVDLFTAIDGTLQQKLQDPETLVAVIFCLCEAQAIAKGVTPEQFGAGIVGDVIDDAAMAMMEAIADFFPSRQRQILTKALAKGRQAMDLATTKAMAKIDSLDIESLIPALSNDTSGSSPASSELPPGLSL